MLLKPKDLGKSEAKAKAGTTLPLHRVKRQEDELRESLCKEQVLLDRERCRLYLGAAKFNSEVRSICNYFPCPVGS